MLTDDEFKCFLKALGKRIRTLRKDKKFNMRDIMIATGYYDAQWRKYEAGGSMNLMSLMKVAMALEVSLVELLDGLGEWPRRSVAEIESKSGRAEKDGRHDLDEDQSEGLADASQIAAKGSRKAARTKASTSTSGGVVTPLGDRQRDGKSAR